MPISSLNYRLVNLAQITELRKFGAKLRRSFFYNISVVRYVTIDSGDSDAAELKK